MIQGMYILVKLMLLCIHLLFAGRVIGRKPKPGILLPLIGLYVLMPIIWVLTSEKYTVVADALDLLLSVAYLPLIKLAFPKFKLRHRIMRFAGFAMIIETPELLLKSSWRMATSHRRWRCCRIVRMR